MLREGNTSRKGQSWVHLTHSYFTPQGHEVNFISGKDVLQRWLDGLIETALAFTRDSHMGTLFSFQFSSVQLFSHVWLFANPWTAAQQASLSIANSWSLLKLMSIESVMPSNHLILCHPLLLPSSFPASGSFPTSHFFTSGGQSIGVSASASVLTMNIQDWFPLGWTGCISLQSKGLLRVFSNTTVQKHQFFDAQLSL